MYHLYQQRCLENYVKFLNIYGTVVTIKEMVRLKLRNSFGDDIHVSLFPISLNKYVTGKSSVVLFDDKQ